MNFSELCEKIYKKFNETTTDSAISNMQQSLKYFITNNLLLNNSDLKTIYNKMHNITFCKEGLINEDSGKSLFGKEAVHYLFWKLIHSANIENTGCNSRSLHKMLHRKLSSFRN